MSQQIQQAQLAQSQLYTSQQQHQLEAYSRNATLTQLVRTADYMSRVLSGSAISFAFMGGFALNLRGSTRETHDVDIAVGCNMLTLLQTLTPLDRVLRPAGPVSGVMRIFINLEGTIAQNKLVEVDLILRSSLGAPDEPATSLDTVPYNQRTYPVVNVSHAISSKLAACFDRADLKDYADIVFLVQRFPQEIFFFRTSLNASHRQNFVTAYIHNNQGPANANKVRRVKHVLGVV
ncbi:MAG: hypothetical protein M1819_001736 [Sarea resinae]|nr:MAG: hypothetical protein M1819_001736 [Sarea resinae]